MHTHVPTHTHARTHTLAHTRTHTHMTNTPPPTPPPHPQVLAMNLVLLVGVRFAGFLANKESIPLPLRWITYLSVFRWGRPFQGRTSLVAE